MVSIVVSTYNGAKYITEALESVLNQTYKDYEIIIVDDGSTDNTKQLLDDYLTSKGYIIENNEDYTFYIPKDGFSTKSHELRAGSIRYYYQKNQGPAAARNRGIKEAKGEYIAFLDSDDVWFPEKLDVQITFLDSHRDIGLIYTPMVVIDERKVANGIRPTVSSGHSYKELIIKGGDYPTSTVVVRKNCFRKSGFFDPNLKRIEDFDMWLRISKYYKVYEHKIPLAFYRRHSQNATLESKSVYESQVYLWRKIISEIANDISLSIPKKNLSRFSYILGKIYYKDGEYQKAFLKVMQAILNYPLVGINFLDKKDNFIKMILKIIKPYIFFTLLFFLVPASKKHDS